MTPTQPLYTSRPRLSIGRQACAAIDRRTSSVSLRPFAPCISFSERNRTTSCLSRFVSSSDRPRRKESFNATRAHGASSRRVLFSTRLRSHSRRKPMLAPGGEHDPARRHPVAAPGRGGDQQQGGQHAVLRGGGRHGKSGKRALSWSALSGASPCDKLPAWFPARAPTSPGSANPTL